MDAKSVSERKLRCSIDRKINAVLFFVDFLILITDLTFSSFSFFVWSGCLSDSEALEEAVHGLGEFCFVLGHFARVDLPHGQANALFYFETGCSVRSV